VACFRRTPRWLAWALACLGSIALPLPAAGHDIPRDVTVQAFLKPEGRRLLLLVRVPLVSLRDMTWPFRAPDVLDLDRAAPVLRDAATLWIGDEATLYEDGRTLGTPRVLAVRATVPDDRSFESYDRALHLVTGPPSHSTETITIKDGLLDVLFEYPIDAESSRLSIDPRWGRLSLRTITAIRLVLPDGRVRAFALEGDPGLVPLDPAWYQAGWRFLKLGFAHILSGPDHLLFLLCLVIPFRRPRDLLIVVTAFTVAHSVTLAASAYDLAPDALWFPPLIETLIAASIVYMALENIVGARIDRRWLAAFGFGLVHGFGFAFALKQTLQFAGAHLLTSLLSFNVGVEIGQIAVLAVLVPAVAIVFRQVVQERMGTILLSAIVAHTAWHWMTDRATQLWQYQFTWPALTPALLADVLRALMVVVAAAAAVWLWNVVVRARRTESADRGF
jgi:hypothetical protein